MYIVGAGKPDYVQVATQIWELLKPKYFMYSDAVVVFSFDR